MPMLKKIIIPIFLFSMIGSTLGCVVHTRNRGGRICSKGFTWNGNACVRERGRGRAPDKVIIHDNRR